MRIETYKDANSVSGHQKRGVGPPCSSDSATVCKVMIGSVLMLGLFAMMEAESSSKKSRRELNYKKMPGTGRYQNITGPWVAKRKLWKVSQGQPYF